MTDGRWKRFCVVGLGGHARTKLLPAIQANGQELVGVVTAKPGEAPATAAVFGTLDAAVRTLPADTAFVIASPPAAHFEQVRTCLDAGRDVIVEKPAFVTLDEAREAAAAAARSGALLVEGFMNRYTATYRHFLAYCGEDRPCALECSFTIPAAPGGTFRTDLGIGASNLYDIASYFLAALVDLDLPLGAVALDAVDRAGQPDRERLHLSGWLAGVRIQALIGIDFAYANRMRVERADGSAVQYQPFFFGRPGARRLMLTRHGETAESVIDDGNAFEAMLGIPRGEWRESQPGRVARMIELTRQLERLGGDLAEFRAGTR